MKGLNDEAKINLAYLAMAKEKHQLTFQNA
jgi:hypothetical protein